ncbi:MAG: hypothetical protein JXR36_05620 [Bacteroidales bacterium]|nr:hypothetical protein [Bacteroidales bacterium]
MKRISTIFLLASMIFTVSQSVLKAQENDEKIKISGYIQTQYQQFFVPDTIGGTTKYFSNFSGGSFTNDLTYNRFQVRRGRLSFTHENKLTNAKLSFDFTEKGFHVKDLYLSAKDPYLKSFEITAGLFNRPFGYEIERSSQYRETPERSRVVQTLFPGERDLGLKLKFRLPEDSNLNFFEISAAIINGNGSAIETDNYKDIIGNLRLFTPSDMENFKASAGFSYYTGKFQHVYEPVDTLASNVNTKYYIYYFGELVDTAGIAYKGFYIDSAQTLASGTTGIGVARKYYGIDGQLEFQSPFGKTEIAAEYIWGTQPAAVNNNNIEKDYVIYNDLNTYSSTGPSVGMAWPLHDQPQPYNPTMAKLTSKNHSTMVRNFSGGYICVVQNIMDTKHQIVIKYDWYDPNTDIAGKDIDLLYYNDTLEVGKTFLSPADVKFSTIGIGWNWQLSENLKLSAYYENVTNEITSIENYIGDLRLGRRSSPGFDRDIKDDVFTVRLQYKF